MHGTAEDLCTARTPSRKSILCSRLTKRNTQGNLCAVCTAQMSFPGKNDNSRVCSGRAARRKLPVLACSCARLLPPAGRGAAQEAGRGAGGAAAAQGRGSRGRRAGARPPVAPRQGSPPPPSSRGPTLSHEGGVAGCARLLLGAPTTSRWPCRFFHMRVPEHDYARPTRLRLVLRKV